MAVTVTRTLEGARQDLQWLLEQAKNQNANTPGRANRSPKKAAALAREQALETALHILESIKE